MASRASRCACSARSAASGDADQPDVAERPVHGEREEGDQTGAARGAGDGTDGEHREGEAQRPAAPQPDCGTGDGAEPLVDDGEGVRGVRIVGQGVRAQYADDDGQQEAAEVDDPVARGTPGPRGRPEQSAPLPPGTGVGTGVGFESVEHRRREEPPSAREHRRGLGNGRRPVTTHVRQIYAATAGATPAES